MFKCLLFNVSSDKLKGRSLGTHRIAHFLREHSWDAEVIDYYQFWNLDQLKELCKLRITADTKFLGFSFLFTEEIGNCQQFWEWLKSSYADIPIIIGSAQKFTLSSPHVDYNICGYGELALLELLDYLFSNGPCPKFTLHMNSGKNISANESYPAFPMDQLTVIYEDRDFIDEEEWLGVEFARGCMFSCDFCNFPVLGVKGDYSRDASDFELQIQDAYDRFGVKNYYVADETFNDRTEKISKFADVVEKLPFDPYFTGYIRADLMINRSRDREELLRMNFLGHHYGIETFHHRAGKAIGKGLDPEKIKQGLLDCKSYFQTHVEKRYRGNISLIVGLPYEPITSIEASEKWMLDNWQGQSFIAYGLYIPVSEYEKESKISMDYQKYGYRSMTKEEIVISQSRRSDLLNSVVKKSLDDKAQLIWVNDQMDIFDALEISTRLEKMRMQQNVDFRLGAFELALAGAGTLDERLDITIANYPLGIKSVQQQLAAIYIEKKLSL